MISGLENLWRNEETYWNKPTDSSSNRRRIQSEVSTEFKYEQPKLLRLRRNQMFSSFLQKYHKSSSDFTLRNLKYSGDLLQDIEYLVQNAKENFHLTEQKCWLWKASDSVIFHCVNNDGQCSALLKLRLLPLSCPKLSMPPSVSY
jgi:hypothetical protein